MPLRLLHPPEVGHHTTPDPRGWQAGRHRSGPPQPSSPPLGRRSPPHCRGFHRPHYRSVTRASALGSHRFSTPLRPHHGTNHSVLDEPLTTFTPDSPAATRHRTRLLRRTLVTWGDLTYLDHSGSRLWLSPTRIQALLGFPLDTELPPCPQQPTHNLRPLQFWLLRGSATRRGGIYRLPLIIPPTGHITLTRWDPSHRRHNTFDLIGTTLTPTTTTRSPRIHELQLFSAPHFSHGGRLIVHLNRASTKGTFLDHIRDSPYSALYATYRLV